MVSKFSALMVVTTCISMLALPAEALEFNICPSAIFGFADSLSDSGNLNIEFKNTSIAGSLPYGITFGNATGRFSDGLLIIDYLAQFLGLDDMEAPSLEFNHSNIFKGLDFGYAGATVTPQVGANLASPHIFPYQVQDFLSYKDRVCEAFPGISDLWFHNALYYIQIGGDDINFALPNHGLNGTKYDVIPKIIQGLNDSITTLRAAGAKHFLILNMPAAGCSPIYLQPLENLPGFHRGHDGCLTEVNDLVQEFNSQIKDLVVNLTLTVPECNFVYFDWYWANINIVTNPEFFGFENVFQACCGRGGGKYNCVEPNAICGCNSTATPCDQPDKYISWDGVHYTQHFYKQMAIAIMEQFYLYPPVKFHPGCKPKQPTF